jgi:hypothetical protein
MKKEDDGAVPLSLPPPPIAAATVARPRRPPHMMRVFSRFSTKKVPLEDTTDSVVVEAEAAARQATVAGRSGTATGYEGVHGGGGRTRTMAAQHHCPHLTPPPAIATVRGSSDCREGTVVVVVVVVVVGNNPNPADRHRS